MTTTPTPAPTITVTLDQRQLNVVQQIMDLALRHSGIQAMPLVTEIATIIERAVAVAARPK